VAPLRKHKFVRRNHDRLQLMRKTFRLQPLSSRENRNLPEPAWLAICARRFAAAGASAPVSHAQDCYRCQPKYDESGQLLVAQDRTARRSTARPRPEHRLNGTGRDPHTSCLRSWHVLAVLETLDGILVLLKSELPEESAFLARSLFEDSLRLKQLQEKPEACIALGPWLGDSFP
jgi:hypothetical protein